MTNRWSAYRVFLDTWLCRIGRIFAWAWLVFWALIGVVGLGSLFDGQPKETLDYTMPFLCLGLAWLHVLLLRYIRKTTDLLSDFRLFAPALARQADKSIPALSAALNRPQEVVAQRLQAMCRRGYLNGYIDHQQRRVVFADEGNRRVAACPGCGARTAVEAAGGVCRYCGSPLSADHTQNESA